ncbi:hypothetical protein PGLA_04655 [Paenibacillus glacialis]|uniref:HNH domain-containing protein n=1 Tax=Paenibacillus glacialis TaxID=494026 RepID=A0A168MI26_9BACL|nr:hypothetical protein PGLA_04655 [Paenibacillus glacialis]
MGLIRCNFCKSKIKLNLHHESYKRVNERLSDLVYLCESCHKTTHDLLNNQKLNLWNMNKRM